MRRGTVVVCVAAVLVGCASIGAPHAPEVSVATSVPDDLATPDDGTTPPQGRVVVAYPDPPATWWARHEDDLAAIDLASLWMLPLYRTDQLGRLVPALVTEARVVTPVVADDAAAWGVRLSLASGSWSDGRPVTASDVVASAEALSAVRGPAWAAFVRAEVVDADVVLWFDRPYASWPWLLSVAPGVLPAHVLADDGLDAYVREVPVSGGWFTVAAQEPGLRVTFGAHEGSPLGAPGLAEVEVLVVPDHDVSLGLLDRGEVDVSMGHTALDPRARRSLVDGAVGAVAFGGSRFELIWDGDGAADATDRRAVASRLDPMPIVEGLLRDMGRTPGGLLPAVTAAPATAPDGPADAATRVQLARTVEGLGLVARLLQTSAARAGMSIELVRVDPPQHVSVPVDVDGRLRLARVHPGRSVAALLASVGLDHAPGVEADAVGLLDRDPAGAPRPAPTPWAASEAMLLGDAWITTVAEVGVAHAWMPDRIEGLTPSGWPGLALWDVGSWRAPQGG